MKTFLVGATVTTGQLTRQRTEEAALPGRAGPRPGETIPCDCRRAAPLLRGTRGRTRRNGHDGTGHRHDSELGRTSRCSRGPAVTYRAELSGRALDQALDQ